MINPCSNELRLEQRSTLILFILELVDVHKKKRTELYTLSFFLCCLYCWRKRKKERANERKKNHIKTLKGQIG